MPNRRKVITTSYTSKKTGATKVSDYTYRYSGPETTHAIKATGTGYQHRGQLTKLSFKSGTLTKAGQEFLNNLPEELRDDFRGQLAVVKDQSEFLTLERWQSHLIENRIERMLFNFGVDPEEFAARTGTSVRDVLDPANWSFATGGGAGTFMNRFRIEYDYDNYNGFKIVEDF